MSIKFLTGLNTGAPFHLIQKQNTTINVAGQSVPIYPESDPHNANGRVKPLMDMIKSGNLGLTRVDVDAIGDKDGNSIDRMTPLMAQALEELVMRAQLEAGVETDKVTSDYNDKTIGMIAQYLDKRGEDSASFTQNVKNLDTREGSNKHSAFDASYTRGKVDVNELFINQNTVTPPITPPNQTIDPASINDANKRLLEAARDGDLDKAKQALKDGAEVGTTDDRGNTPLHFVADSGPADTRDPHALNLPNGIRERAMAGRKNEIAEILIKEGADPKLFNDAGETPKDLAAERNNTLMLSLMEDGAVNQNVVEDFNDEADPTLAGKVVLGLSAAALAAAALAKKGAAPSPTVKSGMSKGLLDQKDPNPHKQTNKQRADTQKAQPQTSKQAKKQQALDTKKHELNSKKSLLESKETALKELQDKTPKQTGRNTAQIADAKKEALQAKKDVVNANKEVLRAEKEAKHANSSTREAKKAAHQADIKGKSKAPAGQSGGFLSKLKDVIKHPIKSLAKIGGTPGKLTAAAIVGIGALLTNKDAREAMEDVIPLKDLPEMVKNGESVQEIATYISDELVLPQDSFQQLGKNNDAAIARVLEKKGLKQTDPATDKFTEAKEHKGNTSLEDQVKDQTSAKTAEFIPPGQGSIG